MLKKSVIATVAIFTLSTATSETQIYGWTPEQSAFIYTEEDVQCLALNIYHESRNEPLAGKVGVADVTLNRVFDSRYPNTVCDVVKDAKLSQWHLSEGRKVPIRDKCQFSWYCDGLPDEPREGTSWQSSQMISRNFLTYGEFRGITEGATHYHASYVSPKWINDRGMKLVGSIGEHIFYRWD